MRELCKNLSEDKIRKKWKNKSNEARKNNVPFSITVEEFIDIYKGGECYFWTNKLGYDKVLFEDEASVDRKVNSLGYVSGNVVLCHKSINRIKGCGDIHQFEAIVKKLKE